MKRNRTTAIVYYIIAVVFYIVAAINIFDKATRSMGGYLVVFRLNVAMSRISVLS